MSNKKMPTYPEMLLMNEKDLEKWIILRTEPAYRKELIHEMILHEEKNHSLNKSTKKITPAQQLILDLFDKNKSSETLKLFEKIEPETGIDLAREAMMAKAATDFCKLNY